MFSLKDSVPIILILDKNFSIKFSKSYYFNKLFLNFKILTWNNE